MDFSAAAPASLPGLPAWYCLQAQPKHERIAAVHLRAYAKLETFAPQIRFQRLRQGHKMWMTEALFPGYFFARFDLAAGRREVQYSRGVRNVVHFGEKYPSVPDALVEQLRALVGPDELTVVEPSPPEQGRPVQVAAGVFAGMETIVTGYLPAKERVKVLLSFMGRDLEVEKPAAGLSPASFVHPLTSL